MAETHINAFYTELSDAEKALGEAQGRVDAAKQGIRDRGGEVPGDKPSKGERDSKGHFVKKPKEAKPAPEPETAPEVPEDVPADEPVDDVPAEPTE